MITSPSDRIAAAPSAMSSCAPKLFFGNAGATLNVLVVVSKIAFGPLAPARKALPSGWRMSGPVSNDVSARSTGALPALDHVPVDGLYSSVFGSPPTSTVKTFPLGNSVQPSSELPSCLPDPVIVQVSVVASSSAWLL